MYKILPHRFPRRVAIFSLFALLLVAGLSIRGTPVALAAGISVDSTADNLTGADGLCTLREAITNANTDSDTTGGDCTAGSGADTITLPAGTYALSIAGAGEDANATGDLDSTICETYGLAKEGARHHGYTGKRGYHPLLAIAAGTGDVLMARLREGRANTARGAAHFLRETVSRVRHAGASGQLTARADSGFYVHALVVACREMDVRFSITIRQHKSPAEPDRGDSRCRLDAGPLLDGRRRRCGGDHLHPLPD